MSSPVSAGLAITLEHRICKPLPLPNLLTWRGQRDEREEGEKRSWSITRGSLLFHTSLPEVRTRRQGRAPLSNQHQCIENKAPTARNSTPSEKKNVLICYFLFCRHCSYSIECLCLSQQMGSQTQANTDLSLSPFSGLFMSFQS